MKIKLLLFATAVTLLSCSGDDSIQSVQNGENIDYYVINRTSLDGDGESVQNVVTYDVVDGKFGSYTIENFYDGVSAGIESHTDYHYQDGKLTEVAETGGVKHFVYDTDGNLTAASLTAEVTPASQINYRFIHNNDGTVFCERLTLPYTETNTEIVYRKILSFDANDNLVSAGADANLDGLPDFVNAYTNTGNDIIAANLASSGNFSFSYTDITDNHSLISKNSYGRKVMFLLCSEVYCSNSIEAIKPVLYSEHIRQDVWSEATYETTSFNFVKKKTQEQNDATPVSIVTEYFFE